MHAQCTPVIVMLFGFAIIILFALLRSKHFFKCIFLSCVSGIASLYAVNVLEGITGFSLAVNAPTLAIVSLGGTPSVIMLLIARIIL